MIATQRFGHGPYYFLVRQVAFLVAGSMAMLFLMSVNPAVLQNKRVVYGALAVVALGLIAALFQSPINGTHRWIQLPGFQLQPSEFAKIAIILFFASFLARREERVNDLTTTLLPLGFILSMIAGLVLLGRDFGTATCLILIASGMVYAAGIQGRYVAAIACALVPLGGYFALSAAYRRERLLTFLNPEADPLGKGFQAMQSLIALGTGGLEGLGIGNGRQKLFFLPEPHTDFIFSIVGEELGLIGALGLLALFGVVAWKGAQAGMRAPDAFGRYLAWGLTGLIVLQALMHCSVVVSLLPSTGVPMPFLTYGGSALVMALVASGLVLNVSQHG